MAYSQGGFSSEDDLRNFLDKPVGGAVENPRNPMQAALLRRQVQGAKRFERNMGGYSDTLYNAAATSARAGLNETNRNIKNDFNARGLLQSGGRMGAELGARADTAAGLASKRAQINAGLLADLQGMEGNAFSTAAGLASPGAKTAGTYLSGAANKIALEGDENKLAADAYGGIAQGIGGLAGSIYNGRKKPKTEYGVDSYSSPAAYDTPMME